MFHRQRFLRVSAWLLAAAVLVPVSFAQTKRPLNHGDYDGWRSIVGQRLSNDGKFLVYGLFPQEGDGEVVIRNLVTGKEQREPAGQRPAPTPPTPGEEGPAVEVRGAVLEFSADSKTVVFSTFPPKADTDKAKKDKKPAPKDGMVIVDLASGKATRVERVKRFAMPEKASGLLVYLKEGPDAPAGAAGSAPARRRGRAISRAAAADVAERHRGARRGPRPEFGTDLVIRNLADSSERTITDVVEFPLTDDGKQVVYAVGARDTAKNGVFAVKPGAADAPVALAEGKGKYAKLTWDENQTQMVFLSDRDDAAAKQPKWKLYRWDRQAPAASVLVSADMPGFRKEFVISDKGTLSFSKDGTRVFFACAPPAPEKKDAAADAPADDTKAVVDLWSYKDDYIQPIQKVRAERDRNRTFTAAYLIPEHKIVQLADSALETVTPSESAQWVLGTDDREYRPLADYDEHYADAYLIDAATGARTLIAKKQRGSMTWSPSGRYLLYFDGKDWNTISVPDGKKTNLTATLGVKFFNEDTDTPSTPGPYGNAGWTKDGKSLLIYDRYDIWRVSPDGTGAKNITAGYGRAHDLRLRYIRTEADNPRERWIDGTKPAHAPGREPQDVRNRILPRLPRWRRAQATRPVAEIHDAAGEGQGRRRLPADRANLQRVPRPGDHRRHLQGTAQGERRQSAKGQPALGNLRSGAVQERRRRAADRRALQAGELRPHEEVPDDGLHLRAADAEREPLRGSAPQPQYQPELLHQQRLPGLHAGHRLHHGLSRARAR